MPTKATKTQTKEKATTKAKAEPLNAVATLPNPETPEQARALKITDKQFENAIIKIRKTGKELRELVQTAAIQAMLAAFGNENYDRINTLFDCVAENMSSSDAKKLKIWFEKYAPLVLRKTDKGNRFRKDTSDSANAFDFVSAHENPWYEVELHTIEEVLKMLNLTNIDSGINSLIKKIEKAIENDAIEGGTVQEFQAKADALKGLLTPANDGDEVKQIEDQRKAA